MYFGAQARRFNCFSDVNQSNNFVIWHALITENSSIVCCYWYTGNNDFFWMQTTGTLNNFNSYQNKKMTIMHKLMKDKTFSKTLVAIHELRKLAYTEVKLCYKSC